LSRVDAEVLSRIRAHNPLLFDFALKRRLNIGGVTLPAPVFQTRARFHT
jgi:mannonate dehydratase